jgi:hypothetical protein
MTQATPEVRPSSGARKPSPFEPSLTVHELEIPIGNVCCASDALSRYAEFSHDETLLYLIDMACDHARTLRAVIYPAHAEATSSKQPN